MVTRPVDTARMRPLSLTVAMEGSVLDQVISRPAVLGSISYSICSVAPTLMMSGRVQVTLMPVGRAGSDTVTETVALRPL